MDGMGMGIIGEDMTTNIDREEEIICLIVFG